MRSLIERSTGKIIGLWPSGQQATISVYNESGALVPFFDKALHEWDENAPDDLVIDDVALYTKSGSEYTKGERVDEKEALKAEILAEVSLSVDSKIEASK